MHRFSKSTKCLSIVLTILLFMISTPVEPIFAAMVETDTVFSGEARLSAREKVRAFLDRKDVQAALTAQGITPLEAKARVERLSDTEIRKIADQINQLPAGGDAVGFLAVAALVFFLVLLITDMLGLTDVFTFINPSRK